MPTAIAEKPAGATNTFDTPGPVISGARGRRMSVGRMLFLIPHDRPL
jgi:hypothetical protein